MGSVRYSNKLQVFPTSAKMMHRMEIPGTTRFCKLTFLMYSGFSVDSMSREPFDAYHQRRDMQIPIAKRFASKTIGPIGIVEKSPEYDVEKGRSATNMSITRLIQVNIVS